MQARVGRAAVLAPEQRDGYEREDAADGQADADGRAFDHEAGHADEWGDQEVVQHHAAAEPEQEFEGDLGEQEPRAPGTQGHAGHADRDPRGEDSRVAHARTSSDVTHFVCNTPGLFGAINRHG
ncbi:hypothetical protein JNUCC0626_02000 [Lentzea sp. JNUCC 0626]|uniref:hypothetical protein n=1 Tax=Lentzea sp. JNUCC 0626 TaxID=3367513 RepID=UPI003748AC71